MPRKHPRSDTSCNKTNPIPSQYYVPGKLYVYTDGSTYKSNPGPISWAVIFIRDGHVVKENGVDRIEVGAAATGTNNRAELMGVIWALEREKREDLEVMTDSLFVLYGAKGIHKRRKNRDLWHRLDEAVAFRTRRGLTTEFTHVRSHQDPFNRQADKLATKHAQSNFASINGSK